MGGAILMQRLVTLNGAAGKTAKQPASAWLDLRHFRDCVLFYDVTQASGSPLLDFQTAPTRDESLMHSVFSTGISTPPIAVSTLALRAMGGGTTQSLARYVRWSVTSASAWSLTFRAWASPNLPSGHDPLVHARQHEIELQPWVTIFGSNKNPPVLQAQNAAIDLENYRDVTVFAEVGTATASSTIEYQTAPTRDERLWQATTGTLALPASGLLTTPIHYDTATCPASRFLRWKLNNTLSASWNVSLRIWVSAKPSGPKPSPELVRHALGQRNLHT